VYVNFIIPYLYEAQHAGRCQVDYEKVQTALSLTLPDNVHQLHVQQPSTYAKPEAASAVLGS